MFDINTKVKSTTFTLTFGAILFLSSQAMAMDWGPVKDDACRGAGVRQYSAVLWNIPWGSSWENSCAATSNASFGPPTRCVNTGGKMWGEWDIRDTTCH
jgi:hypothetical protein